jgi:hypothetical protein
VTLCPIAIVAGRQESTVSRIFPTKVVIGDKPPGLSAVCSNGDDFN